MPEELLQRMADIHYPDAPGWFPPAPGWWLVALLIVTGFALLGWWWRKRQRSQAPYARALVLLNAAHERANAGTLSPRGYLDYCNQILKRLLVHVRHNPVAVAASGSGWLTELDRLHGGTQFSQGVGKQLGDERFAPEVASAPPELHRLLKSFVTQLQSQDEEHQTAALTAVANAEAIP